MGRLRDDRGVSVAWKREPETRKAKIKNKTSPFSYSGDNRKYTQ